MAFKDDVEPLPSHAVLLAASVKPFIQAEHDASPELFETAAVSPHPVILPIARKFAPQAVQKRSQAHTSISPYPFFEPCDRAMKTVGGCSSLNFPTASAGTLPVILESQKIEIAVMYRVATAKRHQPCLLL